MRNSTWLLWILLTLAAMANAAFGQTTVTPILRGLLQTDLNGGQKKITNIVDVTDSAGNSLIGGSKVRLSATDTTPDYLTKKVLKGSNITFTTNNPTGNATLTISATSSGSGTPVLASTNITITSVGGSNAIIGNSRLFDAAGVERIDFRAGNATSIKDDAGVERIQAPAGGGVTFNDETGGGMMAVSSSGVVVSGQLLYQQGIHAGWFLQDSDAFGRAVWAAPPTNGFVGSNVLGTLAYQNTNFVDRAGTAAAISNAMGLSSGLMAFVPTNRLGSAALLSSNAFFPGLSASNRVLTIDPTGNDTLAAADPYHTLWKSAYDVTAATTNSWNPAFGVGALTAAKSGDWVVFNPGVYLVPAIPLNIWGNGQSNGVNLYIPEGVTIIRTNFQQSNAGSLLANETVVGPLIIPGNNSTIIIDGVIVATNKSDGYDSVIGFNANQVGYVGFGANKRYYGYTNWIPTAFWATGNGFLNPPWVRTGTTNLDTVYMLTGTDADSLNNTNICNAYVGGLNLWAAFDNFAVVQNSVGGVNMVTDHVKTTTLNNLASIGFSASSPGTWHDYGSVFTSTTLGGVDANGIFANQPVKIFLNDTTFRLLNGAGTLFSLSGGATVSGNYSVYQEGATTNLSHWTTSTNTVGHLIVNGTTLLTGAATLSSTLNVAGVATLTNAGNLGAFLRLTNSGTLNLPGLAKNSILGTDGNSNAVAVALSGATFDGTTLTITAGGAGTVTGVTNTGAGATLINNSNAAVPVFKSLTNDGTITWTATTTNISAGVTASSLNSNKLDAATVAMFVRTNGYYGREITNGFAGTEYVVAATNGVFINAAANTASNTNRYTGTNAFNATTTVSEVVSNGAYFLGGITNKLGTSNSIAIYGPGTNLVGGLALDGNAANFLGGDGQMHAQSGGGSGTTNNDNAYARTNWLMTINKGLIYQPLTSTGVSGAANDPFTGTGHTNIVVSATNSVTYLITAPTNDFNFVQTTNRPPGVWQAVYWIWPNGTNRLITVGPNISSNLVYGMVNSTFTLTPNQVGKMTIVNNGVSDNDSNTVWTWATDPSSYPTNATVAGLNVLPGSGSNATTALTVQGAISGNGVGITNIIYKCGSGINGFTLTGNQARYGTLDGFQMSAVSPPVGATAEANTSGGINIMPPFYMTNLTVWYQAATPGNGTNLVFRVFTNGVASSYAVQLNATAATKYITNNLTDSLIFVGPVATTNMFSMSVSNTINQTFGSTVGIGWSFQIVK